MKIIGNKMSNASPSGKPRRLQSYNGNPTSTAATENRETRSRKQPMIGGSIKFTQDAKI